MSNNFDYYYGSQADQFSFIRIPRVMLTDSAFAELSMQAKVLYGILLDRMTLSRKNAWFDEKNRVYIIYQIGEIMEDLGFSKKKAMALLSELEKFGLLEKKRRGHGLPNILYVKSFMSGANEALASRGATSDTASPVNRISGDQKSGNPGILGRSNHSNQDGFIPGSPAYDTSGAEGHGSGGPLQRTTWVPSSAPHRESSRSPHEVRFWEPLKNYTNKSNTDLNYIESNQITTHGSGITLQTVSEGRQAAIRSDGSGYDESPSDLAREYRELICENIEYDNLVLTHPNDRELIDGIVDLITETALNNAEFVVIASSRFPSEVVKSKLLKLNYGHIGYVIRCLHDNTTKVKNIKKYLLASLFNAPSTIDGYYLAEVNHDLNGFSAAE